MRDRLQITGKKAAGRMGKLLNRETWGCELFSWQAEKAAAWEVEIEIKKGWITCAR